MASSGMDELEIAARKMMIEMPVISAAGCFYSKAPRQDALPFVVFDLLPRDKVPSFNPGRDMLRRYQLTVKTCASTQGGYSAGAIAKPICDAVYECWTQPVNGVLPQARLNAFLEPKGWTALVPLEYLEIPPYSDTMGDVERWYFGSRFELRIARI